MRTTRRPMPTSPAGASSVATLGLRSSGSLSSSRADRVDVAVASRASSRMPAWALAVATTGTSLAAHRLGGGALPNGVGWLASVAAFVAVWVIARPMRLTSRAVGVLLVVGQVLSHVALELAAPHAMGGALASHDATGGIAASSAMPSMSTSMQGGSSAAEGAATMGASHVMLLAHLVGTVFAWTVAHLLIRLVDGAQARWDALLGRIVLPRIAVRCRRVVVRRESAMAPRPRWGSLAPLRGPPRGPVAAL